MVAVVAPAVRAVGLGEKVTQRGDAKGSFLFASLLGMADKVDRCDVG